MKKLSLLLVLALAGTTACKKSDDKKAAATETAPAEANAETAKPAEAAKPTEEAKAPEAAAPAGAITFKDAADYEAKALEMMDSMIAALSAAGSDCDKAAANMTAFIEKYGSSVESFKKFEAENPDAKASLDEKANAKTEEFMTALGPLMGACQDHEGLKAAMAKMPQ